MLMPRGLAGLARESGIGAAMRHQEKAVRSLGHQVVTNPLRRFDVVHLNTPFPDTPVLATWARLRLRPVLMWAHSTEDDFRDSFTGSKLDRPSLPTLDRNTCTGAAMWFVTPSDYSKQLVPAPKYGISAPDLGAVQRRGHRLLPPGSDGTGTAAGGARTRPRRHRGHQRGDAGGSQGDLGLGRGRQALPEVSFVWYGRTDPRLLTAEVEHALSTAPPNALFPGYVDAEHLREAYAGADVFAFLTKEETEGIVLWEALASETPTLVRGIPLYRDAMPDGVLTHQVTGDGPEFAGQVARKLSALLAGELADLTVPGRQAAEGVDLDQVALQLQEIYRLAAVTPRQHSREIRNGA